MVMENDVEEFSTSKRGVKIEGAVKKELLERENVLERGREREIRR